MEKKEKLKKKIWRINKHKNDSFMQLKING